MFNVHSAPSFDDVHQAVIERADRRLPDSVAHVADLRFDADGLLRAPDLPPLRPNAWATRQLASMLGVRWQTWFSDAISGAERADEINRRLARRPGEVKVRAERDAAGTPIATALLSPGFTPIDDRRVFDALANTLRGLMANFRFVRVDVGVGTHHYTAVHAEARDVRSDRLLVGVHIANSESGASALSMQEFTFRVLCENGLVVDAGGKRLMYRTHRPVEDDVLTATIVMAMSRLPDRWNETLRLIDRAMDVDVLHPDTAVAVVLEDAGVARALSTEAQEIAMREPDRSKWAVVQAITAVAHRPGVDADTRMQMERAAGAYLAAEAAR